ncbi:hypothetical protein HZD82_25475 [Pantoea agglomerans]|nr:hypothetical protein [Pantoea agglomerans]
MRHHTAVTRQIDVGDLFVMLLQLVEKTNRQPSINTSASVNQKMAKIRVVRLPIMMPKPSDSRGHVRF